MDSKKTGWLIIVILLAVIGLTKSGVLISKDDFVRKQLSELPYALDGWRGAAMKYPASLKESFKAEEFIIRGYENAGGQKVKLYAGFFSSRKGTSTHNPDVCYPAQGWKIEEKAAVNLKIEGRNYRLAKRVLTKGLNKKVIIFWYQAGNKTYAHKLLHQLVVIKDAVIKNSMKASIVRISVTQDRSLEEALEIEKEFSRVIIPVLVDYLP